MKLTGKRLEMNAPSNIVLWTLRMLCSFRLQTRMTVLFFLHVSSISVNNKFIESRNKLLYLS